MLSKKIVANSKMKMIKTKKSKMQTFKDVNQLSGHNSPKQNGGSQSKLHTKKKSETKKKNWIASAIKKPGALHTEMGVKQGTKIPAAKLQAASEKKGVLGRRARLAETLKGMNHKSSKKMSPGQKAYMKRVGGKC